MDHHNSLDEVNLIEALLVDVQTSHVSVFNTRALRNTTGVVRRRVREEGLSFLTKTLPRLGKAFDKALCGNPFDCYEVAFERKHPHSKLPKFLGELFEMVLLPNGTVLPNPCASCVRTIRQVCYLFYKYELPNDPKLDQKVIASFVKTELDLSAQVSDLRAIGVVADSLRTTSFPSQVGGERWSTVDELSLPRIARSTAEVLREARILLSNLFYKFNYENIIPRHGPGAVATKQRYQDKFRWSNVSSRITETFPLDAYFYASLGHVCDRYDSIAAITDLDLPAKVILVPKDSRGPRLISCEPVDFQWVQQGVGRAIVEHVESHDLTRGNVFFTDQTPNRMGALIGSRNGRYATLDLKEASDRVSFGLVELLFPPHIFDVLKNCRSLETVLPGGEKLPLLKFAPMGSALCFPVLALTVWSILTASAPDAYTRDRILVYGDDVIVPTANAANAIELLESFGLKVNRDKSCTSGLFRESCGLDAFNGVEVTPVRFRTVWSSRSSAEVYTSWIEYANSMYDRRLFTIYDKIVEMLQRVYRWVPVQNAHFEYPGLRELPLNQRPIKRRWNKNLQKFQFKVRMIKSTSHSPQVDGWTKLLRYFTEGARSQSPHDEWKVRAPRSLAKLLNLAASFNASQYTHRDTSILVYQWR